MITIYSLYYFEDKTGIAFEINDGETYTLINPDFDPENILPESEYANKYPFIYTENNYSDLNFIVAGIEKDGSATPGRITINKQQVLYLVFRILGLSTDSLSSLGSGSASMLFSTEIFSEMIDNQKLIEEQYELLGENSRWTRSGAAFADEALLVLDKNNEVDDYVLFALGILSEDQMSNIMEGLIKDNKVTESVAYDDIIGKTYKILDKADYYVNDSEDGVVDFRTYNVAGDSAKLAKYATYYQNAVENCTNTIKIVGIVRPKPTTNVGSLSTGVVYSKDFTKKMIEHRNSIVETLGQENLSSVASIDEEVPESIQIYINSFDSKEKVKAFIEGYNSQAEANDRITYSDTAGTIMSTVSTIINAITYVLIAFVSISLVVSSIMIGIITYISVLERTKEIGVLRSVGASKRDIKRVFTAESLIIGLIAGVMGILITLILNIPINIIISHLANISGVAALPWLGAVILVAISMLLTFIAGLVPARIASKKDPVVALRTE
ncbi:MAG: ABC transporter permease [Clostridia bacterium]|nr:ABC transporter permease [Clostridia bacterium]